MATILIVGGSGCVGIETTKALLRDGHQVVSLSRGNRPLSPLANVTHVQADILDPQSIHSALEAHAITHVLHAAALRTTDCKKNPSQAVTVNINGTANLLEALSHYGKVERLVFTSTAAVYKVPDDNAFVDESAPTEVLNAYTATKLAAEQLVECYSHSHNLPATILRPQIIYGPTRGSDGSTAGITSAIYKASNGEDFTIPFGGTTYFHYSEDVGHYHAQALLHSPHHFARYNLPGESLDVSSICQSLNTLFPKSSIHHTPLRYPFANGLIDHAFLNDFPNTQRTPLTEAIHTMTQAHPPRPLQPQRHQ
ncbi:NAD-dependent epimerase/dehydratase family protein [Rubritalea tangerina]|uniref:NAD-dependent epimerase/dehydratase family protein n=2 Tax=Rubritalea tangerina TaxID=430798 RepID=A0ABW4Z9A4_9BACT